VSSVPFIFATESGTWLELSVMVAPSTRPLPFDPAVDRGIGLLAITAISLIETWPSPRIDLLYWGIRAKANAIPL